MSRKCLPCLALFIFLLGSSGCQAQATPLIPETHTPEMVPTQTSQNTLPAAENPPSNIIVHAPTQDAGELPAAGSSLQSTQHGVTVSLIRLDVSSTETSLDFTVDLDPSWGFTFGEFDAPAQDAFPHDPPIIVDETGRVYESRAFHGAQGWEKFVNAENGAAHTVGHFVVEPLTGSRLDISIPLMLLTVRLANPIRFTMSNPDHTQLLALDHALAFGKLQAQVKAAEWTGEGDFKLSIDGSAQAGDLRPVCLYLYRDPLFPPPGYQGCFIDENESVNPSDKLSISPIPEPSQPVEVGAAVNVIFLKPFTFTWIRSR